MTNAARHNLANPVRHRFLLLVRSYTYLQARLKIAASIDKSVYYYWCSVIPLVKMSSKFSVARRRRELRRPEDSKVVRRSVQPLSIGGRVVYGMLLRAHCECQ